jgi:PKHD-type hydroxylase
MLLQIPALLNAGDLDVVRRSLAGARFVDGAASANERARSIKRNLQFAAEDPASDPGTRTVHEALRRSPTFFSAALPCHTQGPIFNRYDSGMTYGDHLDAALITSPQLMRSDIATTVFISDPAEYEGGELVIQDSFGAHRVKLAAGSAIVYPASSIHRVEPVTRGSRLAAILWVQSLVRDEARRRILFELDMVIGGLAGTNHAQPLGAVYHNLLRMWAEA